MDMTMSEKNIIYREVDEVKSQIDCNEILSSLAGESVNDWKARIESRILQLVPPRKSKSCIGITDNSNANNSKGVNLKYIKIGAGKLRKLGLLKAPKYVHPDHSTALHNLWLQYINDVLKGCKSDADILKRLLFADFHGAILTVDQSSCPNYINISGVVVHDSNMSFRLAGDDGRVRTVLKPQCKFSLEINGQKYILHGQHLHGPQLARSKLKPKPKATVELGT